MYYPLLYTTTFSRPLEGIWACNLLIVALVCDFRDTCVVVGERAAAATTLAETVPVGLHGTRNNIEMLHVLGKTKTKMDEVVSRLVYSQVVAISRVVSRAM